MVILLVITFMLAERQTKSYGSGFDTYSSCYRTSRQRQPLPCDFTKQNWCNTPGSSYPWHAVRRFVHENQGLMRRMYGDERHISVLRAELENNEIEYFHDAKDKEGTRERYSKTLASTLLAPKERKVEKTKKAISHNSKNTFADSKKKPYNDFEKSTPLLTLKPLATPDTTTSTPSTSQTPLTTASTTEKPTSKWTQNVTTWRTPVKVTQESSVLETTLKPNESLPETTETEYGTTDQPMEVTTEEDFSENYAEQDNYEDSVEDAEEEEDDSPPKSPPILRLKGINACPVKEEVVAPFWANNTRGEVLALLNLYPFEQYVHWEKCSYEHKQMFCREGCKCEQQYRLHRLLAYDPNNECRGIFSDWFRFPSCCVCKCYDVPMELRLTSRSPRSPILDDPDVN